MSVSPLDLFARAEIARPLFSVFLEAALKGTVVLAAAWALTRALRHASASIRHFIWTAGLAGVLIMPLLATLTPRLEIALPVLAAGDAPGAVASASRVETPAASPSAIVAPSDAAAGMSVRTPVERSLRDRVPSRADLARTAPLIWLFVVLVVFARIALGTARLSVWTRRAHPVLDGRWLSLTRRLADRLQIERPVSLLRSGRACIPMTWGIVYPVVLLPNDSDDWSDDRRAIVLLHELAHVQRFDALTQFIAQFAVALFWFNPLVWLAARQMRSERERACDDVVLACGARASDYASDLLQIARGLAGSAGAPAVAALAMARRGEFEGRLLAILDPRTRRQGVSRARALGVSLAVIALSLPLAALTPAKTARARGGVVPVPVATIAAPTPVSRDTATVVAGVTASRSEAPRSMSRMAAEPAALTLPALPPLPVAGVLPNTKVVATAPELNAPSVRVSPPPPDRETLIAVLRQALKMTSDYDKAELLVAVAKHYTPDDEVRTAYLDAVMSMHSSYDQSRTLLPLLMKDDLPASSVAQIVKVVSRMSSDNDKASVLARVMNDRVVLTSGVRDAIIAAAGTIRSDNDRSRTLVAVAKGGELANAQLINLLGTVKAMSSGYEKANVLVAVSARYPLTDKTVRGAFLDAAESISSGSDYRRVMTGLLR
jgi:beta-lactamase regulating signal transducer with metallopeptidase domain